MQPSDHGFDTRAVSAEPTAPLFRVPLWIWRPTPGQRYAGAEEPPSPLAQTVTAPRTGSCGHLFEEGALLLFLLSRIVGVSSSSCNVFHSHFLTRPYFFFRLTSFSIDAVAPLCLAYSVRWRHAGVPTLPRASETTPCQRSLNRLAQHSRALPRAACRFGLGRVAPTRNRRWDGGGVRRSRPRADERLNPIL